MKPKLRDFRNKGMFLMDDEYMNGYAKLCGWKATITYNSLCRHANKDQYAFPSIKLIAEENSVSKDTIMEGIKTLEEWNIIKVTKFRTKQGAFKNNGYDLLDKSEWKPKPIVDQVAHSNMDQVATVDMVQYDHSNMDEPTTNTTTAIYKDTHNIKDTHIFKDTPLKGGVEDIFQFFLEKSGFKRVLLTPTRKTKIQARLKTFTLAEIKEAITHAYEDSFYSGNNNRGWKADIDYIFRSDEIIDRLLNLSPRKETDPFVFKD